MLDEYLRNIRVERRTYAMLLVHMLTFLPGHP